MGNVFGTLLVSVGMVALGIFLTEESFRDSTDGTYSVFWMLILAGGMGVLASVVAFFQQLFTGRSLLDDDE